MKKIMNIKLKKNYGFRFEQKNMHINEKIMDL